MLPGSLHCCSHQASSTMPGCHPPIRVNTTAAVTRAVTRIQQLFAPAIAVLSLVSGADQNAIGCTPHGQIRLPGSAVDLRLAGSAAGWPRPRSRASALSGAWRHGPFFILFWGGWGAGADRGGRVGLGQGEAPG